MENKDREELILEKLWETVDTESGIARVQALKEIARIEERRKSREVLKADGVRIRIRFVAPMVREASDDNA